MKTDFFWGGPQKCDAITCAELPDRQRPDIALVCRLFIVMSQSKCPSNSCAIVMSYCKRGNFRMGVIFTFFALLSSSRKLPP